MAVNSLSNVRNIGIIAHVDAGKTTTTERILYFSGTKHKVGDVDSGDTTTDFDPLERAKGITINSAAVSVDWGANQINIIDTPGHVDFTAEVERSLRVLDGAVVVFSAREGVEAQSETVWRQADRYGVPRIALVNKLDREGADFFGTVRQIEGRLAARPLVLQVPLGLGPPHVKDPFRGLVDLVEMRLLTFPPKDETLAGGEALARVTTAPIPEELAAEAALYREQLVATLFDCSDEIAELGVAFGQRFFDLRAHTLGPRFCPEDADANRVAASPFTRSARARASPSRRRRGCGLQPTSSGPKCRG